MRAMWITTGVLGAILLVVWGGWNCRRQSSLLPAPNASEAPRWSPPSSPQGDVPAPKAKPESKPAPTAKPEPPPKSKPAPEPKPEPAPESKLKREAKPAPKPLRLSSLFQPSREPPIYALPLRFHLTAPEVPPELVEPSPPRPAGKPESVPSSVPLPTAKKS